MFWTGSVVEDILRNEVYTGAVVSLKSGVDKVTGKLRRKPKSDWVRVDQ